VIAGGRDTVNACAVGMAVGTFMAANQLSTNEGVFTALNWAMVAELVDNAAQALDAWQKQIAGSSGPEAVWAVFDWYETVDAIAAAFCADPDESWTTARIAALAVRL
jgi:hypothetical protein